MGGVLVPGRDWVSEAVRTAVVCIGLVGTVQGHLEGQQSPADAYARGRALIEAGDALGALEIWTVARDSLTEARAEDPRIGHAFVEVVADLELPEYEDLATDFFYWGLSARTAGREPYRTEVLAEGRRTFALVDSATADYWSELGAEDPVALALAIKGFWVERDPTPTTLVNERLLEHWRRISDARDRYIYTKRSVYGTDDRGVFFVKYGEPDNIVGGTMSVSSGEQHMIGVPQVVIDRYDRFPQFELWRYIGLRHRGFTYFLFGNEGGSGQFRHVEGVHELIPPGARSFNVSGDINQTGSAIRGRRAVHYLEWAYYQDAARMGGPYAERADELDRIWLGRSEPYDAAMRATSFRYADTDRNQLRMPRPPVLSPYDDSPKSVLSTQAARILDGDEPLVMLLAVSSPLWRPEVNDGELADTFELSGYTANHTVIARNHNLQEVARANMEPIDADGSLSQLLIRHARSLAHLTVAVQHEFAEPVEAQGEDGDTIGVLPGHSHFALKPPLFRAPTAAEVSDLIVGIVPRPGLLPDDMPVPLLPANRLWRDDLLRVYFEIYHPLAAADGESRDFDVRLQVLRRTTERPDDNELENATPAIVVALESVAPTATHHVDLDLRNEDPGLLELVLTVTDPATLDSYVRTASVDLLEN